MFDTALVFSKTITLWNPIRLVDHDCFVCCHEHGLFPVESFLPEDPFDLPIPTSTTDISRFFTPVLKMVDNSKLIKRHIYFRGISRSKYLRGHTHPSPITYILIPTHASLLIFVVAINISHSLSSAPTFVDELTLPCLFASSTKIVSRYWLFFNSVELQISNTILSTHRFAFVFPLEACSCVLFGLFPNYA